MGYYTNICKKHANRRLAAMLHCCTLSDEDCKAIHDLTDIKELAAQIIENGPPFTAAEVKTLVKASGGQYGGRSFDDDGDNWLDDTLSKYAEHIRNYKYNYIEEAKKVDPSIDTKTEHIGPMAQDIEKVNPAAVQTDKSGYKVVDTGRLALMNAGAIADLAREVQELKHG